MCLPDSTAPYTQTYVYGREGGAESKSQLHAHSRSTSSHAAPAAMASKSVSHHDWDYEKLQEELRKQTEIR